MEFDELLALVVPTIISHAWSTSGHYNLEINFKLDFRFEILGLEF
jgi:hypothetical protein